MQTIDLKNEVAKAIQVEWPAFAARHPHLAAALDQRLLVEQASALLEEDPAYRAAMEKAAAVEWAGESIHGVVRRFVGDFFRKIVG